MKIIRTSILSGTTRELEIDITQGQYDEWLRGVPVQIAFPALSADEREFIKTGITAEEWDEVFGQEEEEEALLSGGAR